MVSVSCPAEADSCFQSQWNIWQLKSIFLKLVETNQSKKESDTGARCIRWTQTWLQMKYHCCWRLLVANMLAIKRYFLKMYYCVFMRGPATLDSCTRRPVSLCWLSVDWLSGPPVCSGLIKCSVVTLADTAAALWARTLRRLHRRGSAQMCCVGV